MKIKAGYKTTEFWFTLVSFIFSGLYLVGILKENEQKEELIQIVSHAVESTILISGQALILYKYIKGRNEVKKIASKTIVETTETTDTTDDKKETKPITKTTKKKTTKTPQKKKTKKTVKKHDK